MSIDTLIDDILRREGGYVNNPNDKGGPTKYGITLGTLAGTGRWGDFDKDGDVDAEDVKIMSIQDAKALYLKQYVEPFSNYILWRDLHELLVDSGVQHGVSRVLTWLQDIKSTDPDLIYKLLLTRRMRFYGEIITKRPQNAVFAAGWMNRLSEFVR